MAQASSAGNPLIPRRWGELSGALLVDSLEAEAKTKGVAMETIINTLRFKDASFARQWSADRRISSVQNAISISEPYQENNSPSAPFAIDIELPMSATAVVPRQFLPVLPWRR